MGRGHLRVDISADRFIGDGPVEVVVELAQGWMEGGASVPGTARVLQRIEARQDAMLSLLAEAVGAEEHMSKEVDDLVAQVTATDGVMQSATVLLQGMDSRLAAMQDELGAQGVDTAAVVAMRQDLQTNTAALAEAVAAIPPTTPTAAEPVTEGAPPA